MRIRFRHTTPSDRPEFPFQAGQIIDIDELTPEMRDAVKSGRAELVKDEPETAIVGGGGETAVLPRAKGRRG